MGSTSSGTPSNSITRSLLHDAGRAPAQDRSVLTLRLNEDLPTRCAFDCRAAGGGLLTALGGMDDQYVTGRTVRQVRRHRAQQAARQAVQAPVADHNEFHGALLGDMGQHLDGGALPWRLLAVPGTRLD